jgi:GntR family transcriptional regulator
MVGEVTAMEGALQAYLRQAASDGPKHAQLRGALVMAIDDGLFRDERLPTEQELTRITPFSLGTVQRAIRALVEEGRIERVKGRGSFVNDRPRGIAQPFLHVRFLSGEDETYLPIFPKVLSRQRLRERGPWSDLLGQRDDNILRIERTMRAADEFAVYSLFYINAERYPAFAAKSLKMLAAGNFKLMLAREYNLPPIVYHHTLEIAPLSQDAVRTLALARGTVGGIFRMQTHAGAQPLFYQELHVPPNGRQMRLPDMVLPTGR